MLPVLCISRNRLHKEVSLAKTVEIQSWLFRVWWCCGSFLGVFKSWPFGYLAASLSCALSEPLITQFLAVKLSYHESLAFWRKDRLWFPGWAQGEIRGYQSKRPGVKQRKKKQQEEDSWDTVNNYILAAVPLPWKSPSRFSCYCDHTG